MPKGVYIRKKGLKRRKLTHWTLSKETREKMSEAKKGNTYGFKKGFIPYNKGKKRLDMVGNTFRNGKYHSENTKIKMYNSSRKGESSPFWRGGTTKESLAARSSFKYRLWRKAVFERDNYTCQECKRKEEVSGKLNAHHIKAFSIYKELRLMLSNGITLCEECHRKTDTYLWKSSSTKLKENL